MVTGRKKFILSHRKDDGWWVLTQDGHYVSRHHTRDEGAREGRRVAKLNEPSQLIVKRLDGTFGEEDTYLFDPVRTRG